MIATTATTTVQQRNNVSHHQRSCSYDSAYYYSNNSNNNHITIITNRTKDDPKQMNNNKQQQKQRCSFSVLHDDNITLVADEDDETNRKYNDIIYYISQYMSDLYSRYSPAIVLENKGNTARDHLANERTYLAWFRTSMSLITLGVAIIQVYHVSAAHHKGFGRALGLIFVMASILFLYFGNVRYFHAQWALQHGNFPASRGVITWASFCILILFVGMFTIMILETDIGQS